MSEDIKTQEKIDALKQQLKEAQAKTPEAPKEEVPKEETPEIVATVTYSDGSVQPVSIETEIDVKYIPPDPTAKLLNDSPLHIVWIDNRYHINGIRGTGSNNKIIVRELSDIDVLVKDLLGAVKNFHQEEMISTKK